MGDTEDDWLFDSIRKYKALLMFDLHNAATSLTWVGDKSICASTEGNEKYEVLELSLPEKILTSTDSEGLCSDRDFRMLSGGFSAEALKEVKHIPKTRLVAATKKDTNGLSVLRLGDSNTDLIEECGKIENPKRTSRPATLDCSSNQVVFGSRLSDMCVVDTSTNMITGQSQNFSSDDPLSKLFLLDANVLLACCLRSGEVWRMDLRCGIDKRECLCSRETTSTGVTDQTCGYWTYDVQKNEECQSPGVFSLAPGGHVAKMDLRNVQKSAFVVKLSEMTSYNSPQDGYGAFKVSPTHKDIVSVSGLDQCVHVYNFNTVVDGSVIQSDFMHDGHMACSSQSKPVTVTDHIWHPWQPNLILSSATDGSLHAWQREGT